MTVDTFGPRVGCGAAIIEGGRLLLVRRRRAPEAGCWGLPGGKINLFEPVAEAVAREILEELGVIIRPTNLLCVVDQIDRAEGQHWISPVFLVDQFDGIPKIMEPDAISDLGWFEMKALPAGITEATRQALIAIEKKAQAA